jgi:hypothetical protein
MLENAGKDPEKAPVAPEILHMFAQFRPVL